MPSSWICIDANLVVRLVLEPEDNIINSELQRAEAEGRRLAAPALVYYEVTNALYQYQRHGAFDAEVARVAQEAALSLPLQLYSDTALHRAALRLSQQLSLPGTYDAHYLALAEHLDAELWTGDRRLVRAVRAEFPSVRLLQGD